MKKTSARPNRHRRENITSSIIDAPASLPTVMMTVGTPRRISQISHEGTGARLAVGGVLLIQLIYGDI